SAEGTAPADAALTDPGVRATVSGSSGDRQEPLRIAATVLRSIPVPDEGVDVLFGAYDENLRVFEDLFDVQVRTSGHELVVEGEPEQLDRVEAFVGQFAALVRDGYRFAKGEV